MWDWLAISVHGQTLVAKCLQGEIHEKMRRIANSAAVHIHVVGFRSGQASQPGRYGFLPVQ
jgi:protein involved in polysaccharide export with SLBB domain